ncbi:hypothetical protein DUNSADRAFT_9101 [Dunaliella salina]|uniref:FAD-binding domain-containing protein n=1 Tax=Dunaliella salina TaxID=3046 RepID=A0ABQ7H5L3_DUNSA|nr:hypothetical protein DUNSADRAFT_9101 [Dunaliella salina]|eukprot:KAF5842142.1 hypothetical protein DUNSADRAFT_9101 [Dunaliella salina]
MMLHTLPLTNPHPRVLAFGHFQGQYCHRVNKEVRVHEQGCPFPLRRRRMSSQGRRHRNLGFGSRLVLRSQGASPTLQDAGFTQEGEKHEVDMVALQKAASAAQNLPYSGRKAVVVGAGPGGSTAAMVLARQGFTVDVFEKRPEPAADVVDTGRAYIIALIPRGQATLERLGIPLPSSDHYRSLGTVRHPDKGEQRVTQETGNRTFSRSDLAQMLVDEARRRFPSQIKFHFGREASKINLAEKQVTLSAQDELDLVLSYDLLVGADGTGSRVRAAMQEQDGWTAEISDSGREYKVYQGLRADLEPPEFKGKTGATLHLYTTNDSFTTVTAHRNPDNSYSGTFSMRTGEHAKYNTQEAYEALLREKFSALPPHWVPEIAKQAVQAKASSAGKRIKCPQLHSNGAIILGDAAHAVTPVFGQGANSALESCRVLDDTLTACTDPSTGKGEPQLIPAAFSKERKADVHALWWIDAAAYSFFAKRPGVDFFALLAHVLVGTVFGKLLPGLYGGPKPALLSLGKASMPYSSIYQAVQRDAAGVLAGLGTFLLLISLKIAGVL